MEVSKIQNSKTTKEGNGPPETPSRLCCQLKAFYPPSSPLPPMLQLFIFLASLCPTRTATYIKMSKIKKLKRTKEQDDPP
jgi:hypothetical protein